MLSLTIPQGFLNNFQQITKSSNSKNKKYLFY